MKKIAIGIFIIVSLFFVQTKNASAQYYYPTNTFYSRWNQGWNGWWNQGWYGGYVQPVWNQGWNTPYYNTGWNQGWNGWWNQGWWSGGWNQGWNGGFGYAQVAIPFNRGGWLSIGLGW